MKLLAPVLLSCAAGLMVSSANATDAAYPAKPITIIVPWTTGGSPDLLARLIGEKLSQRLGQSVIIENKPGASGTIGAAQVARAPADGYTLMSTPNTFPISQLVLPKNVVPFDVQKDFTPVSLPSKAVMVMAAHHSLGVKTLDELVSYAKKNPGVTYAGSANGSPQQIAGEMFRRAAGISMTFVPYKGVAPAVTDAVGGHVKVLIAPYGNVEPYAKSGVLHILGSFEEEELDAAPGVKPIRDQGYPNVAVPVWTGFFAPAGTPRPIVEKLNAEIDQIIQLPDVKERLLGNGQTLVGGKPEVLANRVKQDLEAYAPVVKAANITAD